MCADRRPGPAGLAQPEPPVGAAFLSLGAVGLSQKGPDFNFAQIPAERVLILTPASAPAGVSPAGGPQLWLTDGARGLPTEK